MLKLSAAPNGPLIIHSSIWRMRRWLREEEEDEGRRQSSRETDVELCDGDVNVLATAMSKSANAGLSGGVGACAVRWASDAPGRQISASAEQNVY